MSNGVAKSTLFDAVRRGHLAKKGRQTILEAELEARIAEWVSCMAHIGYGQTKSDIQDKVQELVKKLKITTPWPNDRPSEKWYRGFMNRHPNLHYRMVSALCKERASVSFDNIFEWFMDLRNFLIETGNQDMFEDPTRIYNCDETGFPLAPKPKKVIVERGGTHHYQSGIANTKAQITVLLCCSAVGHYTKPLVVYPGVQPRTELRQHFHDTFNEGLFGNSESGWMDTKLFADWLENGFNDCIVRRRVTKPVILFIDGAKVHLSIEASEYCSRNNIILYTLYPNATHIIQPLDLVLMGSVKSTYKEEMRKWLVNHVGETFDKYRFVEVFKETYMRSCNVTNAVQGFEKAGIAPWNPQKVKTSKLFPAELYEKQEPMPQVAADNSTIESTEEPNAATGTADMPGTSKSNDAAMGKETEKPMTITVGKKRFKLIEVEEETEKTKETKINEVLSTPKPKVKKQMGCRVPGLPRCVSSQEFRDRVKEIEDKKQVKRDEIEKRKAERKEKAEKKKEEKKKAAEERKAKKAATKKGSTKRKRKVQESSEEEEEE